ncbi:hypothetical protein AB4874_14180 [Thioclava sp. 15-R06ZXC-3]|uniref:TFIIB-type domain-containing protein n=1 Tax=Thioclava arctica TaxID=3238301 RepID=A0ABV3TPU7_9RHOB
MSEDLVSATCGKCGEPLTIDLNDAPDDDDIIMCNNCGAEIGTLGAIRKAMIAKGKAEIEKITMKAFGKKPTWRQ